MVTIREINELSKAAGFFESIFGGDKENKQEEKQNKIPSIPLSERMNSFFYFLTDSVDSHCRQLEVNCNEFGQTHSRDVGDSLEIISTQPQHPAGFSSLAVDSSITYLNIRVRRILPGSKIDRDLSSKSDDNINTENHPIWSIQFTTQGKFSYAKSFLFENRLPQKPTISKLITKVCQELYPLVQSNYPDQP
jgi:hypothetical protein